jgi:hypothetical protein
VFCGGMIPVTGRLALEQVSWAIPARWGFAATASTTDLRTIAPLLRTNETLWSHHVGWWLLDMTALILVGAVLAGCVRWRIRLNAAAPILDHTGWYRWCMRLGSRLPMGRRSRQAWAHAQARCGRFRRRAGSPVLAGERLTSSASA